MNEEEMQELQNEALLKYGKSWDELTEEEKQALYYDYEGRRATLNDEFGRAYERASGSMPEGVQAEIGRAHV